MELRPFASSVASDYRVYLLTLCAILFHAFESSIIFKTNKQTNKQTVILRVERSARALAHKPPDFPFALL